MDDMKNNIGLAYVPKRKATTSIVGPPIPARKKVISIHEFEHTWELLYYYLIHGLKNIKGLVKSFIIPLAIVMGLTIFLESIPTYSLSGIMRPLVLFAVALTGAYNSLIPRTIYWIVLFTIGKKLFYRMRKDGVRTTFKSFRGFPSLIHDAKDILGKTFILVMTSGVGFGFIAANFLTRNNRFDKSIVTIVLAITILDTLLRGNHSMFYVATKLIHKDLARLARKKAVFTDSHIFSVGLSFSFGLLGNLIFAVLKLDTAGYIVGAVLLIPAWAFLHASRIRRGRH